jgi:hypothetical protein
MIGDLRRFEMPERSILPANCNAIRSDRRSFVGGSDARIIMGDDEPNLVRLWREKRGEAEPEDLSANLIVQLGTITEELNRRWYERNSGHAVKDVQKRLQHPVHKWMAATLDGMVEPLGAVFEAKFMLPWTFSEGAAAEKHMAQLQHNMWVTSSRSAVLSIITGGGKWVEMTIHADPLYQHLLLTAEKKFWRCVESGDARRQTLIICVLPSRGRSAARSAMSSPSRCAGSITANCTGMAQRPNGGRILRLIRCRSRTGCGSTRGKMAPTRILIPPADLSHDLISTNRSQSAQLT